MAKVKYRRITAKEAKEIRSLDKERSGIMVLRTFFLAPETDKLLKRLARSVKVSKNAVIRYAFAKYLEKENARASP